MLSRNFVSLWLGVVVVGCLAGPSAYAQDGQALTRPPGVLVSAWVGPTSALRNRVADSIGRELKRRVQPAAMFVVTRAEALNHGDTREWPAGLGRPDLLEFGKSMAADYIVDIDIDDDRSGPQLTTLLIERETNAERRLERIPFDDPARAVRTLVDRIASDSIMTKRIRERCDVAFYEFQVDRQADLIRSSVKLPQRSPHGEGEVLAMFIVDSRGGVVPGTFKSLKATTGAMLREVMDDIPSWHFTPAWSRKCGLVSQVIQMPIQR